MYETVKHIARKFIPGNFLKKNESFFRSLIAYRYKGNKHQCNICEFNLSRFVDMGDFGLLCPNCGSLPRTRRLWSLIKDDFAGKKILHFSPPKNIRNKISGIESVEYVTTDYAEEFESDLSLDITNIDIEDNSFDLIICYHVLEHIQNDEKAMSELFRILNRGGLCFIQTPFIEGEIYEDANIRSNEERKKYFGQEDHVRIYSANGLKQRLEQVGFHVEIRHFKEKNENLYGFGENETVLICQKKQDE